jgi:flavodoxin/formate hydrogenlyase subunit 6/NADH:ubiquinone oxidoreductase subunit I
MSKNLLPIFYFSGTGNTWWAAQRLAEELGKRKFQTSAHSIERVSREEVNQLIDQAKIVALGYPIYASDAPLIMQDFIRALPKNKQPKRMLVFVTQAFWSGDGAYFIRPEVESKGYRIDWAVHFNMPNNISLDLGFFINAFFGLFHAKPADTLKRIKKLADRVSKNSPWLMGRSPFFSLGWIQRIPYRKEIHRWQSGVYQVNTEKCNACARCERLCPVDNITLINGLPHFDDHCNLCLRCFNYCPQLAIEAFGKSFNEERYGKKPYQGPIPEFRPELLINAFTENDIEHEISF